MRQLFILKNDLKQTMRDPITGILLFAPLLIILVFKLFVMFLFPVLQPFISFGIGDYYGYLFSFVLLLISGMLGMVMGFLMIDDKDGNIAELMSVTPIGRSGYLANRLMLTGFMTFVYSMLAYYVLDIVTLPFAAMLFLAFMQTLYSCIIGILLFSGADDKVKGLTYSKALNVIMLFSLTDLLELPWLTVLSWFFPTYWITKVIFMPNAAIYYLIAFVVHGVWFVTLLLRFHRKQSGF